MSQDALLERLESEPGESVGLAMARVGVSRGQLREWKKDPTFYMRWSEISRSRREPARMPAPRQATTATAKRVLDNFDASPTLGLTAHCRAAGTTVKRLEAACAADPQLQVRLESARDGLVVPIEQKQIQAMLEDPKATAARSRFLARNAGHEWGDPKAQGTPAAPAVTVNLALLANTPKAERLEDGRYRPVDIPLSRLEAGDVLPGMEDET